MKYAISEILDMVSKERDRNKKIEILQKWKTVPLMTILKGALDNEIVWLLPEGELPYEPIDVIGSKGNLYQETRKLYRFIEHGQENRISEEKLVSLFCDLLCRLYPDDADLMNNVKDKKIPYKTITASLVNEAFPGLLSHGKK